MKFLSWRWVIARRFWDATRLIRLIKVIRENMQRNSRGKLFEFLIRVNKKIFLILVTFLRQICHRNAQSINFQKMRNNNGNFWAKFGELSLWPIQRFVQLIHKTFTKNRRIRLMDTKKAKTIFCGLLSVLTFFGRVRLAILKLSVFSWRMDELVTWTTTKWIKFLLITKVHLKCRKVSNFTFLRFNLLISSRTLKNS